MRTIPLIVLLGVLAGCSGTKPPTTPVVVPIPQSESTISWERNSESDMKDYVVYACWTKDCTNLKAVGTVTHPAVGVKPEFKVYLSSKAGTFAVTARDTYGNESGYSNLVPFDRR